ncbi:hypothetical protein GXW82_18860 [Streptacidiphilus sp. 4-A2]|nr:hypothetical protein [Streptacidiphilus sp. 4-A2]
MPPWDTVEALVEILATRAPGRTPQQTLPEVHALWVLASEQRSLLPRAEREVAERGQSRPSRCSRPSGRGPWSWMCGSGSWRATR